MTDEELLMLYATGRVRAMEDLYHRHRVGLYSYIYNQVRDRTVADDIMQDVWSRLILDTERIVSMIEDEALTFSLQSYLYRMARNRGIDHFRARGWLREMEGGETYLVSDTPPPESVLSEADLYACLERRMRDLRIELHDAFWLTRDGRMTYQQAASALDVATETVKDWVRQVLRAIRPLPGRSLITMDTDTELRLLEEQFPKSSQLWNTDTDPALDRRILAIADGVAPYFAQQHMRKEQARQSEDRDRGSPPPEYRPTMRHLPKHLKLGTKSRVESSIPYLQKFDRMDTPPVEQSNIPPAKRTATPAGADSMLALLEGADPQTWLDGIAAIVRRGDIELAIYLLRQYRIVFRDK